MPKPKSVIVSGQKILITFTCALTGLSIAIIVAEKTEASRIPES